MHRPNQPDGTSTLEMQRTYISQIQLLRRSSKPLMSRVSPDTSVEVDVSVSETADRDHHAVGVERRAGDRASLCGCEKGGVGLDGVDACAVDVEEGEGVCV